MRELLTAIPDPDMLLALTPEELGARVLFLLKERPPQERTFHLGNLALDLEALHGPRGEPNPYGDKRRQSVLALYEAVGWLESQGLIVRSPDQDADRGWRTLSRRALRMNHESDLATFLAARMLPRELLHPSIADEVWSSFLRGQYDTAVFQAMRQVEVAVREASGFGDKVGVDLVRNAFRPRTEKAAIAGPLTLTDLAVGEQEGMMHLFSGALAALKNPHSHRVVNFETPADAAAIIVFASQLLRIVDYRSIA